MFLPNVAMLQGDNKNAVPELHSMMKFEDIWPEFCWVIDELNSGMAFFEGYIPFVHMGDIEHCLQEFSKPDSISYSCDPCWMSESDIPDREQDYSISQCAKLFIDGKLADFDLEYEKEYDRIISHQKLMFMPHNAGADVTIICFADWILSSSKPKEAIEIAIAEMREIKRLFNSEELYIGPDGLDVSSQNCLRID